MNHKTLNTIAAVTTIFAGIFALAAALIPITTLIAAPVALGFALVSGFSWLAAARCEKEEKPSNNVNVVAPKKKRVPEITPEQNIQHSLSPHLHTHHVADLQHQHDDLTR